MDVRNRTPLTGNALARDSRHISMAERAAVKHTAAAAPAMTAVAIQPTIISPPFTLNCPMILRFAVMCMSMMLPDVSGNALPGRAPDLRTDLLDRHHQRIAEQHGP
jgi:hypothetical protein